MAMPLKLIGMYSDSVFISGIIRMRNCDHTAKFSHQLNVRILSNHYKERQFTGETGSIGKILNRQTLNRQNRALAGWTNRMYRQLTVEQLIARLVGCFSTYFQDGVIFELDCFIAPDAN